MAHDRGGGGAVAATAVILFVFLIASASVGRDLSSLAAPEALTIKVTGHQWWWEVEYVDPLPSRHLVTANEIHIPAGRPVALQLTSHDVIHSFWVPNLHGKKDLIPSHVTTLWLGPTSQVCFVASARSFAATSTPSWDSW